MKKLILSLLVISTGCAYMKSNTHSITKNQLIQGTNNVQIVEQDTHSRAWTFFDANSSLTKFRNGSGNSSVGTNTYSPGTYASGINESSSGSNVVNIAASVAAAAVQAALSAK